MPQNTSPTKSVMATALDWLLLAVSLSCRATQPKYLAVERSCRFGATRERAGEQLVARQVGAEARHSTYLPVVTVNDGLVPPHAGMELEAHSDGGRSRAGLHTYIHVSRNVRPSSVPGDDRSVVRVRLTLTTCVTDSHI